MTIATDNFVRANASTLGASWSSQTASSFGIVSNSAVNQGGFSSAADFWNANTFGANQFSQATITTLVTSNWGGVIVRASNTANTYYSLETNGSTGTGNTYIRRSVAGTLVELLALGITFASGDVMRLEASGTTLTAKKNGTVIGTVTDPTISSGFPGLTCYGGGDVFNTWSGGDLGGAALVGLNTSSGPGISPDKRTTFSARPLSAQIIPGTFSGFSTWQAFAFGQLTAAAAAASSGYTRSSGPGVSPDYNQTFFRPPLSTTLPIIAPIRGVAVGSGYVFGLSAGVGALAGVASWQGISSTATLLGAGALSGLASAEGAAFGALGNGLLSNITGVALWSGAAAGSLQGTGALRGLASGEAATKAVLTGAGALQGAASWQGFAFAPTSGVIGALTGVAAWQLYATGPVTGQAALQGRASGQAQANGAVLGVGALSGIAAGQGYTYGTVLGAGALGGLATGQCYTLGTMLGTAQIRGVAIGQAHPYGLLLPVGAGSMQGLSIGASFAYGAASGNSHRFGWAVVTALSQNGLPVARACYIEESASFVTASYFDAAGIPFIPSALQYRVDDVASGSNIVPWTAISASEVSTVTITSAQNAMISSSRSSEAHQVLFQITDGFGNVSYADVSYDLIRVAGLA